MELTYNYVSPKRLDCGHIVTKGNKFYDEKVTITIETEDEN